jgi:large subunit ribosomal protein L10
MENPRPEKVAVVDEVRERLNSANASVVTEYRGLTVAELASLRASLSAVGGDYKIFKNTLVRLAVAGSDYEVLTDLLSGPTAIAFVKGDVGAVAKALRDFSRTSPNLVMKGGYLEGHLVSSGELSVLADLPSRDVLLARIAGAIAAPLQKLGALIQAVPQNFAYGLSALLEQRKAADPAGAAAAEAAAAPVPEADAPATEEASTEAAEESPAEETAVVPAESADEAPADETAEAPAEETAEAPAEQTAEAPAEETAEAPAEETAEAAEEPAAEVSPAEEPAAEEPAAEEPAAE